MLYFTSDTHLGHESVIAYKQRPFSNVEEMNDRLIQNINDTVGMNDELWILGDFAYKVRKEDVRHLRNRIRCKQVHLVMGNHDKDYSHDGIFQSVQHYKELKTEYGRIVLFHYPILEWNAAHYGTVHLHGHIHSTRDYNSNNLGKKYIDRFPYYGHTPKIDGLNLRIYDVGVDANCYKPISMDQIVELMNLKKIKEQKENR